MKKHIIGLTLFSFIVSAAAIVYAVFNVPEIVQVAAQRYVVAERTHCKMKRAVDNSQADSPVVTQAVFDLKTKQLNWELVAPLSSDSKIAVSFSDADSKIALHFFVKNKNGTRYLNSVLTPSFATPENFVIKSSGSYEWLDNLDSYENLYVTAESTSWKKFHDKTVQPKFNAEKATSVLLYSGEQGYLTEKYFRDAKE